MKRILAMLLSVICVLSFTCVSIYADEKSEDEEKAASIAESYLSAAAKNMWLYESNNLAEHTIQELVDTSGNSLLSDMSTDVNTQKILSSMDNITFVQEKSKYFREMRQRQDIQRNDFALEYTVTSASIEDNVATLSIIEHICLSYRYYANIGRIYLTYLFSSSYLIIFLLSQHLGFHRPLARLTLEFHVGLF